MLPHQPDLAPLPDPPAEASTSRWRNVPVFVALGLASAAVGWGIGEYWEGPDIGPVTLSLALVLGIPGVLAVHEVGHVVGGRLARFQFALFIAGPLRIWREGERIRVGLNKSLALAGGLALSLPTDSANLRQRTALAVAGGPVASLLLGVAGVALGGAWGIIGIVSLGIAAVTLIPTTTSGFLTDGARLLRLAQGGGAADREAALLALVAESISGARPREWTPELVARSSVEPIPGDPLADAGWALATAVALDRGDAHATRDLLVRRIGVWETIPPATRGGLVGDAALFEAAVRGDAGQARTWLDRMPPRAVLADPAGQALVEAFVLRAEGDLDAARIQIGTARESLSGGLDEGMAVTRRDWLDALESTLDRQRESAA